MTYDHYSPNKILLSQVRATNQWKETWGADAEESVFLIRLMYAKH